MKQPRRDARATHAPGGAGGAVPGALPSPAWAPILRRLVQGARLRRRPATWSLGCEHPCGGWVETRVDPRSYSWDGINRATDARGPFAIFQLTLAGFGELELPGVGPQALPEGTAFLVPVPSAHRYYLPQRSPGWTFGWFDVHHPYVVERIARHVGAHGPILHLTPDDPFTAVAVRLIDRLTRREFADAFEREGALFEFVVACDRFMHHSRYPAPAAFATAVRIREAARMLLSTQAPLKEIADALGFANVNHFCRVFRRHHHTSPAAYRRRP